MTALEQELWTLMSEYLAQGKAIDHTYLTDPRRVDIMARKAADEEERAYLAVSGGHIDRCPVICTDCGWQGQGYQLLAQACPVCDGRCADL